MRQVRGSARTGRGRAARTRCGPPRTGPPGPPTRIVVNRASGSSREVLTPIRRWMSVPGRERVERRRSARAGPRARACARSRPAREGRQLGPPPPGRARRPRRRPPGRPSARAAARIAVVRVRVVEERGGVEERLGVEGLVLDQARGAGRDQARGVGPLVAGGVRIRARRPPAGRGRSPRPASTSRPGRRAGRPPRGRPASRHAGTGTADSAARSRLGQPVAPRQGGRVAVVAGDVDDVTRSTSRGSASATAALNRRTACEPPNTSSTRSSAGTPIRMPGRGPVDGPRAPGWACPSRSSGRPGQRRLAPGTSLERDRERRRQPGGGPDARPGITLPSHSTTGMRSGAAAIRTGMAT